MEVKTIIKILFQKFVKKNFSNVLGNFECSAWASLFSREHPQNQDYNLRSISGIKFFSNERWYFSIRGNTLIIRGNFLIPRVNAINFIGFSLFVGIILSLREIPLGHFSKDNASSVWKYSFPGTFFSENLSPLSTLAIRSLLDFGTFLRLSNTVQSGAKVVPQLGYFIDKGVWNFRSWLYTLQFQRLLVFLPQKYQGPTLNWTTTFRQYFGQEIGWGACFKIRWACGRNIVKKCSR